MGLLTQMQQAHLSQGKSDGRGPIRMGELVKRGLPVNANKSFEKRLLSPEAGRRDHIAYGNHRFNAWAKENPNATFAEQKAARSVFASMWGDLPWEERLRFNAMQAVPAADLATDETESAAISPCGTLWQDTIGTDSIPLDDRHMEHFLCSACGSVPNTSPGDGFGVNRGGVRNRYQPIRHALRESRVVRGDDRNVQAMYGIPEDPIPVRMSCSEAHYGVCPRDDDYLLKLQLAIAFQTHFGKSMKWRFYKVTVRRGLADETISLGLRTTVSDGQQFESIECGLFL